MFYSAKLYGNSLNREYTTSDNVGHIWLELYWYDIPLI